MELLMADISHVSTTYQIKPLTYWPEQQLKFVFYQLEFVNKNNLETENPRRDISILSISAGLLPASLPSVIV